MNELQLVHLPLDLACFARWASTRDCAWTHWEDRRGRSLTAFDEGRALHHLLGETFGAGTLQPFRLMKSAGSTRGNLYAYSAFDATALMTTARETALPDALDVCNVEGLAVKTMPGTWNAGRRLAFDLRLRPVKRLLKPAGGFRKGAELDAYLVEALRRFPAGAPPDEADRLDRGEVYVSWLAQRLGDGAKLVEANVRMVRFERSRVARAGAAPEGPDVTIHGEMVVQDPQRFSALLARGVGRHVAYGYGMLLLRPAGPA